MIHLPCVSVIRKGIFGPICHLGACFFAQNSKNSLRNLSDCQRNKGKKGQSYKINEASIYTH